MKIKFYVGRDGTWWKRTTPAWVNGYRPASTITPARPGEHP